MATSGVNPTPRVNKGFMQLYKNQVVRVVCRVKAINGTVLEVQASDGGSVTVYARDGMSASSYTLNQVTEIIGKVRDDLALEEFNSTPFSDTFDFENFEQLVQLTHSHQSLFGTAQQ